MPGVWTTGNWPASQPHGWDAYEQIPAGHGAHPDLSHPQLGSSSQTHYMEQRRSRPVPSASPCSSSSSHSTRQINSQLTHLEQPQRRATAPTPSRSQQPVEDPPKKPLTLACLFCRKRKIACGSPPPGQKDRTCK